MNMSVELTVALPLPAAVILLEKQNCPHSAAYVRLRLLRVQMTDKKDGEGNKYNRIDIFNKVFGNGGELERLRRSGHGIFCDAILCYIRYHHHHAHETMSK